MQNDQAKMAFAKVPEVTLLFWIMKIVATTLGETGGDTLSMSIGLGYLVSTFLFAFIFIAAVYIQIKSDKFHPVYYWSTIVATTTVGTTLADFADRSMGVGYAGGTLFLLFLLITSFTAWYKTLGSVSINTIATPKEEAFYWMTIMFSQTLGTALGDWVADSAGFGYIGSAVIFGSILIVLTLMYYFTKLSRTALFWMAFVLTRPLGAVLGDFLDKPIDHGGLDLSRWVVSLILLAFIAGCIYFLPQKAAERGH
ncbi:MAG: hypothetical protein ACHQAX_07905 [Gammaproteobacteria bacterium]